MTGIYLRVIVVFGWSWGVCYCIVVISNPAINCHSDPPEAERNLKISPRLFGGIEMTEL